MKGFAVAKVASSKARAVRGPPYSRARLAAMAVHAVRNDVARLVYRIPHGCLRRVSLFDVALRQSFPSDAHALPAHDVAAIERRIIRAQVLYAFGAALCVINRYWSIAFIFLVQLNHALVPRLRRPARS
jgi:hypothetical protein